MKTNNWVWTEKAQLRWEEVKKEKSLRTDEIRTAGASVPKGCLLEGHSEYFPYRSWVHKGYVEKLNN